jgi:Cdc6-like AAA superfamily ATPase
VPSISNNKVSQWSITALQVACAKLSTECLRWLKVDNGSDRINRAAPGTCEWIFGHPEVKSWSGSDNDSVLWICGKAGSGKSTLMKYITQHLEDTTAQIPRPTIASFFFHISQGTSNTTSRALLQSFIFQILSQVPSAMSDFVPLLSKQRGCYTKLDESCSRWRPWMS